MNILAHWHEQLTPKSLKTIGSLWRQNSREFFSILIRDWWWLIITTIATYLLIIMPLIKFINDDDPASIAIQLPQSPLELEGLILLSCLAFGMLRTVSLLIAHSTKQAQDKQYYRSHKLFFAITTLITGFIFSVFMFSEATRINIQVDTSMFTALEQLYLFFACFFILDAQKSIREYLRALTILPLKLLIFNLPITVLLYLLLITINWAPAALSILLLAPLFIVLCGIVYKLTINSNYEDYYPAN